MQLRKNPFNILLVVLLFMSFGLINCAGDEEDCARGSSSVGTTHSERSNNALAAWNIGLTQNVFSSGTRNMGTGSTAYNPPHWIIMTDDTGIGQGIDTIANGDPLSDPNVAAYCLTRSVNDGILDNTMVFRQSFMEDTTNTAADRQSVYTHEVGHCLGLTHAGDWGGDTTNVMWLNTNGAETPSCGELAAIAEAYPSSGTAAPSGTGDTTTPTNSTGNIKYFNLINDASVTPNVVYAIRNKTFPEFTIYTLDTSGASVKTTTSLPPLGEPITGPLKVTIHIYYRDKSYRTKIIK